MFVFLRSEESDGSATPDDLENKKSANTKEKQDGSVDDQDQNVEVNPRDEPEAPSITEVASNTEKSSGPPEKNEDNNCSRNQSDESAEKENTDSTTLSDPGVENKSNDDNSRNQSDESVEKQKKDGKQINDENKSQKDCSRKQLDESAEEKEAHSNKSDESPEKEKDESVEKTVLKKRPNLESDEDDKKKHSSDSEDFDFAKFNTKKEKEKRSKQKKKKLLSSDSENESSDKGKAEESESASSAKSEEESQEKTDKTRRRIKRLKDSSSEAEDGTDTEKSPEKSTRKQLKKIIEKSNLSESTKQAEKEERERKARILEKQKKYNQIFDAELLKKSTVDKIVLDFDEDTKSELLTVHKQLVKHLKPHQAAGIKFMWDACFESLERARKVGSGCILAHCMGLGKTLQVVTLCHTLLTNSNKTGVEKVMVVCPLNTVLNWVDEFKKWLPKSSSFEVFEIVSHKQNSGRQFIVNEWFNDGGVLIIGYDMFRNLANENNKRLSKKMRGDFHRGLIDPGPDVVVCDEGHLLKNEKTSLSIAMNRLKTLRRIVLTGTPLQNNLKEYYCMVQFVKPNLLGTYKEYLNRFVNPITNGQYTDSTPMDIHIMRRRSHVLHKLLDGVVQRRDYCVLAPYLPPKHEYVLFLSLTQKQIDLYRHYMNNRAKNQDVTVTKGKASFLFADFQEFQRICTHPKVLQDKSLVDREKEKNYDSDEEEDSEGSIKDFIDDDEDDAKSTSSESSSSSSKSDVSISSNKKKKQKTRVTRAAAAAAGGIDEIIKNHEEETKPVEWWEQFLSEEDLENINFSSKLFLLFEILAQCEAIGDKILVFSQSLYSLNVIEYFLHKIDDATQNGKTCCGFSGSWSLGLDYFRIDGSSSCDNRAAWCRSFNDPENIRARLFLISTRAGGLGINLVAANRVIIFDVSWNPSHDTQSIYRVYRFGQTKPCYIYRFVTLGTMEMKIYERQVTKQAISKRVIDEQQIDRHYNQNDLMELYKFEPVPEGERPTPLVPKDVLLGELLQHFADRIYKYHEHQTLLENKEDEVLDEDERKAAWEEFENEKNTRAFTTGYWMGIPMERATNAIRRILLRELPQLDAQQLNVMIFTRMKQIEAEVKQANNENYSKVIAEINRIQVEQEQKFREHCMQQQAMKMMQQQFALTGRPEYLNALQHLQNQQLANFGGRSGVFAYNTQQPPQNVSNEIIDLNE